MKRAETYYANKLIVSRTSEAKTHRLTSAEWGKRTRRLSDALIKLGVEKGDKVASFAWNQHRHLEAYFAVPCIGSCLHMVNIRLSAEHIAFIINHAEDKVLIIDEDLVPIIKSNKNSRCTNNLVRR